MLAHAGPNLDKIPGQLPIWTIKINDSIISQYCLNTLFEIESKR